MYRHRTLRLATSALLLGLLAFQARAETIAWDQAAVTSLAQKLATAAKGWEDAARTAPEDQIGSGTADDEASLPQKARTLREMADALAAHLAAGKGQGETRNQYRSLREVADDTVVMTERAMLTADTSAAWAKTLALVKQLAPYYGVEQAR